LIHLLIETKKVRMAEPRLHEPSWERMIRAVEKVRDRALRAARALEAADIPYAVAGGNAVADWVSRVDEAAVRNTRDVDIVLRRADLQRAIAAMGQAGFVYRHAASIDMFLDGPDAKARDAVHVVFAGERVREADLLPVPDVDESVGSDRFQVVNLEALVGMKLTSFRLKDKVHLLDMLDVGLIDHTWLGRLPKELAARLQEMLDQPD
jgi:hypothetical protein